MKVTKSGNLKHRKLQKEGYLQRVSAEQREYAGACASPRMTGKSTLFRTFLKRHQLKIALGTGSTILTG